MKFLTVLSTTPTTLIVTLLFLLVLSSSSPFTTTTLVQANTNIPTFISHPFDGTISKFQFINKYVILVQTSKFTYLSINEGQTFQKLNDKLLNCNEYNCIDTIYTHNQDENIFLLVSNRKQVFYTCSYLGNDVTCTERAFPKAANSEDSKSATIFTKLIFHPNFHDTFLVLTNQGNVFITHNLGNTFTHTKENVKDINFSNKESKLYSDFTLLGIKNEPGTVIASDTTSYFFSVDYRKGLAGDDNELVIHAKEFMNYGPFLFVVTSEDDEDSDGEDEGLPFQKNNRKLKLYVSRDNGHSFNAIKIPKVEDGIIERTFTILDGSEGQVFLNIDQTSKSSSSSKFGTVYLSDSYGVSYSISLLYNKRNSEHADFFKVKSLEGVYLSNVVDFYSSSSSRVRSVSSSNSNNNPIQAEQLCNSCSGYDDCLQKCKTKTMITFDKGSHWKYLSVCSSDANTNIGDDDEKAKKCRLHLHGITSTIGATSKGKYLFTQKEAVGLVVGNGNVGENLDSHIVNTYLSRDGGLQWTEIAKGSHFIEMTDHGGIIVLAQTKQPTKSIQYSLDQGNSFQTENFTNLQTGAYHVMNAIYSNSKFNTLSKYIYLHTINSDQATNHIITRIDFSTVFDRNCKGHENPTDPESDYEYFKPHTYSTTTTNNNCFLGRVIEYTRRKRLSKCFNSEAFENRPIKIKNCQCTYLDYECDYGYERKDIFNFNNNENNNNQMRFECVAIPEVIESDDFNYNSKLSCLTNNYFNESKGYIKIPGDSCVEGISNELEPIRKTCPSNISVFGIILLIIFFIIILLFSCLFIYKHSPLLQHLFGLKNNYTYHQMLDDLNNKNNKKNEERYHNNDFEEDEEQGNVSSNQQRNVSNNNNGSGLGSVNNKGTALKGLGIDSLNEMNFEYDEEDNRLGIDLEDDEDDLEEPEILNEHSLMSHPLSTGNNNVITTATNTNASSVNNDSNKQE